MTVDARRIARFARALARHPGRIWRTPVELRSLRAAWQRSGRDVLRNHAETGRQPTMVVGVYEGPVTFRPAWRHIRLDALGQYGTPVEDWLTDVLAPEGLAGGTLARIEVTVLAHDRPDPDATDPRRPIR